ncbi:MAG TPA: PHB depolymerase family esterase [Polyangiaceae bacterium]
MYESFRTLSTLAVFGTLMGAGVACERPERGQAPVSASPATRNAAPASSLAAVSASVPGTAAPDSKTPVPSAVEPSKEPPIEAELHVPKSAAKTDRLPLVLLLHGLGASAEALAEHTDWAAFAEKARFAWLSPNGPKDHLGRRFWNASDACCNFDRVKVDHVRGLGELLKRTVAGGRIDPERVFVVGYSNGGFMAHRLACELPAGAVRGIVSLAGAGPLAAVACTPQPSLRVLQVHGDADKAVAYAGGPIFGNAGWPVHPSAEKTVADWAARLGCKRSTAPIAALDFDAKLAGAETSVERFTRCAPALVELWTIRGGAHNIGLHSPSQEAIWKFLND